MNNFNTIITGIESLPVPIQKQILDYTEFLLNKYKPKRKSEKTKFKFDWEGGLKKRYPKISSVELQHKANKLR